MTLEEAKAIAKKNDEYVSSLNEDKACLDGWFTADELEAYSIIMRALAAGTTHEG